MKLKIVQRLSKQQTKNTNLETVHITQMLNLCGVKKDLNQTQLKPH